MKCNSRAGVWGQRFERFDFQKLWVQFTASGMLCQTWDQQLGLCWAYAQLCGAVLGHIGTILGICLSHLRLFWVCFGLCL